MIFTLRASIVLAAILAILHVPTASAQCDYMGDDSETIQSLLDAAAAKGGGTVQLQACAYYTTQTLILPSNVYLRGAGRGATVIVGSTHVDGKVIANSFAGATIAAVGASNVSISDLTIDHKTCARDSNGIAFLPTTSAPDDDQLYDGAPTTNALIERVEILGGGPKYHNYMIWNMRGRHVKILNNWIDGDVRESSGQEGIESFGGYDVLIANNTVKNIGGACINLGSAGVARTETVGLFAVNNYLTRCEVGINLGTSSAGGDQYNAESRLRGNIITNVRQTGIDIPVMPGTHEFDLDVSHNTIRGVSADDQAAGIRLWANGDALSSEAISSSVLEGNQIAEVRGGNAQGIRLVGFPNARILNNTIVGTDSDGIYAYDAADIEVSANRVEVCPLASCSSGRTAITLQRSSTGSIERFVVERNVIGNWSPDTAAILVIGAKWGVLRNNSFKRGDQANPTPIVVDDSSCGVYVELNKRLYHRNEAWTEQAVPACMQ